MSTLQDKDEEKLGLHFNNNVSWLLIVNNVDAEYLIAETIRILTNVKQKSCAAIEIDELNCSTPVNQIVK